MIDCQMCSDSCSRSSSASMAPRRRDRPCPAAAASEDTGTTPWLAVTLAAPVQPPDACAAGPGCVSPGQAGGAGGSGWTRCAPVVPAAACAGASAGASNGQAGLDIAARGKGKAWPPPLAAAGRAGPLLPLAGCVTDSRGAAAIRRLAPGRDVWVSTMRERRGSAETASPPMTGCSGGPALSLTSSLGTLRLPGTWPGALVAAPGIASGMTDGIAPGIASGGPAGMAGGIAASISPDSALGISPDSAAGIAVGSTGAPPCPPGPGPVHAEPPSPHVAAAAHGAEPTAAVPAPGP